MNIRTTIIFGLAAMLVAVPAASALPGGTDGLPRPPNTAGCNGGEKGFESCGAGQCPGGDASSGQRSGGCTDFACSTPDWSVTPEGGDNCLDMLCRNVPPTIGFVQVTLAPVLTLLGNTIPGVTIVRAVVLNAGFSCEHGFGPSGPGNPCQRILWTPVGSVGADPEEIVTTGGQTGTECSWAQSGVTGYNWVGDNGFEYSLMDGECKVVVHTTIVMGYQYEHYTFSDSCSP